MTPPEFAGQLVSSSGVVFDLNSQLPPEQYTWEPLPSPLPVQPDEVALEGAMPSSRARTLAHLSSLAPSTMVDVTIEFEDVAVPIPVMTRLSQPDRDAVISDREAAIKIYQQPYRDFLKGQLGAVTQTPLWIINALQVQMKAGDVIGIVDTWPDVINITVSHSNITPETTGTVFRQGTGIADLRALGLSTPRWGILGVIDSTPLDTSHPTYSSRVERYVDCNSCLENFIGICYRWGCADATGVPTPDSNTYASHASDMVYRVIGGNGPTGSADGGALQDAEVRVYKIANTDAVASALQNAVSVGARAVDMSLSLDLTPGDGCARNTDYSGLNSIIRRAVHTGTIFVKSAGNDGNDPGCTLTYPAQRPEVLSVAALQNGSIYDNLGRTSFSSRGPVIARRSSGHRVRAASVGVAAPGRPVFAPVGPPTWVYQNTTPIDFDLTSGTSPAAALTTGVAGFAAFNYEAMGWTRGAGPELLVNLFTTSDRFASDLGADLGGGISPETGFGRVKTFVPETSNLTGGSWAWGWRRFRADVGVHRWPVWTPGPEHPSNSQWKWSVATFPEDLDSIDGWMIAIAADRGPPDGSGFEIVAVDARVDYRLSIHLTGDQICPPTHCRCLEMNLLVLSGNPMVYSADYIHSGASLH